MGHKPDNRHDDEQWWKGPHAVLELLRADPTRIEALFATPQALGRLKNSLAAALPSHIKVRSVDRARLDQLCGASDHQGIAARLAIDVRLLDRQDLLNMAAKLEPPALLLVLDGIEDPHNLGALVRSADAAGAAAVILAKDRSAPLSSTAVRASAGALAHVPIARVPNLAQTIIALKDCGWWCVGLDMQGDCSLFDLDPFDKTVLALGAEGKGLGRTVLKACDLVCSIPLAGKVESLNASVAGALGLFEVVRKRKI
ncbi:MAG: 23S rRNA (guanosine(2251)-2'-O)-methyltransferase RlmB [Candidatus Alcyoniella australis]|nr:23S rRNA (guanosine(2251)-2'-O)-methyltransferase RlmB [Candidatus Alcyoniella australis]